LKINPNKEISPPFVTYVFITSPFFKGGPRGILFWHYLFKNNLNGQFSKENTPTYFFKVNKRYLT